MAPVNCSRAARKSAAVQTTRLKSALRIHLYKRWFVRYSWKHGYPKGDPSDWKSWRSVAVVPILFRSEQAAYDYLNSISFKNLRHLRKLSASVEVRWLKERPQ